MPYSNVSRPRGFVPLAPAGRVNAIVVPRPVAAVRHASSGGNANTDMAVGDAYSLDANGNAYRAGPNDSVRGVVWGFRQQANPLVMNAMGPISIEYITGLMGGVGTAQVATILGIEDAGVWFECSSDTAAVANVGGLFNLADAAPDSLFRSSQQTISIGGGAGAQFRLEQIINSPADNVAGANAQVAVSLEQTFND